MKKKIKKIANILLSSNYVEITPNYIQFTYIVPIPVDYNLELIYSNNKPNYVVLKCSHYIYMVYDIELGRYIRNDAMNPIVLDVMYGNHDSRISHLSTYVAGGRDNYKLLIAFIKDKIKKFEFIKGSGILNIIYPNTVD